MKTVFLFARCLLGITFFVFGLNKLHLFIPQPILHGLGAQFMSALCLSHFLRVVAALEVAGGVLLLTNRYVPLGLTLLGPVVINILLFHLFFARENIPIASFIGFEWFLAFWPVRSAFSGIFEQKVAPG